MYHCFIHFYLVGLGREESEALTEMPAFEHFVHMFTESTQPDLSLAARADVILADLRKLDDPSAVRALAGAKRREAQLLLLAGQEQIPLLSDSLSEITGIWTAPLSRELLQFYFLRWQQSYKQSKDLWQASHFLEATINSVPNLVWYKTKDGIHEKVNDSFCKTVNKTKQQVEGRGHAYIWDVEQDDPACIESERIVMETEQTLVSEETVLTGAGTRLLTTYKSPLYDLDGSVMGTVGVGIDITQERAYKEEILQKTRALEQLFTTMDCGILTHSLDGSRIYSVNRAALEILDYRSQEELAADGFLMVARTVMEEDKTRLRECIQSLKDVGDNVNLEYRVVHKDGSIRHVMGNIKLVEEDGRQFYQRFLLDCTAQKLREEQERTEQERRQNELVQALSTDYNLVCFYNLDSGVGGPLRTHDCPHGTLDEIFTGERPIAESLSSYIDRCVLAEDRSMLLQALSPEELAEQLIEKVTYTVNYRTLCGDEIRYFQMKAVRAGSWDASRGVVLGFRSVDEETRRELEKKSLLEDALAQANQASKAKSVFLSNMSHDIRTPMNAIVGFTTLAITHLEQKEQVEGYLKKILTSSNHLVSLINDVLDMSRIESGKMHLDEALCSLPDILHSLRSIIQADVRAKQLDLYIDTVDVLDEDVYCDKLRLNQVLLNLLSNAVKYTGAGGIVSMRIIEKPGAPAGFANYEFRVKDTGIGMSPEFVARIFEPFERERNSTISGIQGTGLGMAITKNIVDMMNGSIQVESEQGVGSEFIVSFTFRLHDKPKEVQTIPELQNCRALVVDDDFNTCDSVSYMLQQFGMRAEWTMSGKEAVLRTRQAFMRHDSYSVYIIDWLMPDMNGIEVTRRIRSEVGGDVPIIVLTAYDVSDIEDEAFQAGVTAFCSKPLFMSELRSCLTSVLVSQADGQPRPDQPQDGQTGAFRHTGRILLAEDNELNQEIATAILTEAGFQVEVAANGQIALDMLTAQQAGYYQLILMDVQMPVMDGYAAARAIRALDNRELASTPILAMTANAFAEDREDALRAGMNGHIAKPINITTLMETLDQSIGTQSV
ncbi:response regulator [Colidextribacter sp. OB.20]|uniref:hybrid sensor histidine kinase/response regulator n=1 Tax=Colidextribacter sp. OB.20 TaxID=2304568 RepID=UPI00136B4EF9|nr:response regulator [Colidextribacter sp. OB.20]NBI10101.1 response regulator [Colidextribacter sp. OB.20]